MAELTTFDPIRLAEPTIEVKSIEGVGDVKFAKLTMKDYLSVKDLPNETEDDAYQQGLEMTHRMLVKAYPELTKEHMLAWPPQQLMAVTKALLSTEDFRGEKSGSGSGSATKPKRSGASAGSLKSSHQKS